MRRWPSCLWTATNPKNRSKRQTADYSDSTDDSGQGGWPETLQEFTRNRNVDGKILYLRLRHLGRSIEALR